jgi:endonuclease-3 related protein
VEEAREQLLAVRGIGPETADAILLYAGGGRSFVIDAYTRRILVRAGVCAQDDPYDVLRERFMRALPRSVPLYREYHALFVIHGRMVCTRRTPRCRACLLRNACERRISLPDVSRPAKHPSSMDR